MAGDIKTGSSLCESCALFGADYSNEYNNWITSRKQYESVFCVFYIPYHRSDVYPGFPSLTRSGDAGCELCAALKHRVQSKHYRPQKKSALYRFWKEDKVKLTGGFLQDHSVVAKNATVPATSLFIKVIYTKRLLGKFRGHYTHIIKMDALRTNQGSAIVYPPVLPFAAETTLCPQNISLIHRWLNDCEINHPSCKKSDVRNFLPTRLICVKSDSAWLVETRQFSDSERQLAHYLALSHCWGPKTEFQYKTTSQNLSSRLQSMVFANFPQNIKDAISVCRALGVKYLWIDSICIIQNLPHDLAREMEVMLEVYANAHVTISATCAASADKGFLSRTPKPGPKLNIPRQGGSKINGKDDSIVIFTEGRGLILSEMWKTQVVDSPWNQRAWTLQEALVSPRIVYFANERLFFECSTLDCLEGANISRAFMSQRPNLNLQNEGNSVPINFLRQQDTLGFFHHNSESFRMDQMYRDYYIVIERYTARKLTFVEDRAAACSAIIEGITRITQSPVHHGLLMSDVRQGLQWCGKYLPLFDEQERLNQWPTWSWLSYPGPVYFRSKFDSSLSEEGGMTQIHLNDEIFRNSQANYSGSVNKRLHLEGFLIPASIHNNTRSWAQYPVFVKGKNVCSANLDYDKPSTRHFPLQSFIFSLGETESEKRRRKELPAGPFAVPGQMLVRHDETSFKRVGVCRIFGCNKSISWENESKWILKDVQRERIILV